MWGRPVRQATAHVRPPAAPDGEAGGAAPENNVLVHRNELNEQQRPGDLVLVPRKRRGDSWEAKLIRSMGSAAGDPSNVMCDGLLFYSGADIKRGGLDKHGKIEAALKKPRVLFITNHKVRQGSNTLLLSLLFSLAEL